MAITKVKLAVFDVDGTIATRSVIGPEIVAGFKHLHDLGYITTISTGRGYSRVRDVFGDRFEQLISEDALIILEHGTKIVDRSGNIVFAENFDPSEMEEVIEFIRANIELVKLIWYYPKGSASRMKVWCYDERELEEELASRGNYADVFSSSFGKLRELLLEDSLSNVSVRMRSHVKVHNLKLSLTHSPINLVFQDGNLEFLKNNANKGLAVQYLLHHYQLKAADLLVAGNAINDVEMLDSDAAFRVVVGPEHEREPVMARLSDPEHTLTMQTPEDLGLWLQGLT
jgi:HAD superfamily hydrolase (TIGR01484 family)